MKTDNLTHAATRLVNQQHRIKEGVKSGDLTPKEAKRAEKAESRIARQMAKDVYDNGSIGKREAAKLDKMQDRASKAIYGNKHDRQNDHTPRVDKREGHLAQRVQQGVDSGALNKREAARLDKRLDRLDAKEAAAKADGVVTRHERRELRQTENRISAGVWNQKHDAQKARSSSPASGSGDAPSAPGFSVGRPVPMPIQPPFTDPSQPAGLKPTATKNPVTIGDIAGFQPKSPNKPLTIGDLAGVEPSAPQKPLTIGDLANK